MRPRRTEAEQQWRRERILAAGAAVFTRLGVRGATIDEIAREADYSPAALYKYFKSKEEILAGVFQATARRFAEVMREAVPEGLDFAGKLRWRLRRMFGLAEAHRELFIALDAVRDGIPCTPAAVPGVPEQAAFLESLRMWEEMMTEGIAQGALRPDATPGDYAIAFMSLGRGIVFQWLATENPAPLADKADFVVRLFLEGAQR